MRESLLGEPFSDGVADIMPPDVLDPTIVSQEVRDIGLCIPSL
jgi:hypothetical protein